MAQNKKNIRQKSIPLRKPVNKVPDNPVSVIIRSKYFIPVSLFILCFFLYGNSIFNDYTLDDGFYTTKNKFIVQGFSAFKDIFNKGSLYGFNTDNATQYRPLTLLNFMGEVSLFGFNPHINHFFNVLFFALTVVLLFYFLQKLLSQKDSSGRSYNPAIILAATLIFAFHPIHTEVIASIKSRDEILGLLFGLISFYFIFLHIEKNKNSYYIISIAAFLAAIFCKENCLTFLAIIPLLLYFFTSLEIKKVIIKSIPYAACAGFYLLVRGMVLQSMTFNSEVSVMFNSLMAADSASDRIATSIVLLGKYIYMTIIPYPLSYDYSYNQIPNVSWANIKPILSLLACLCLIGYMFWGLKKKSIYSFLIAFFFITLFLSSNLVIKIAWTFGERFLYTPSLSFCIALPILISRAIKLDPFQPVWKNKNYFYLPVAILLIVYTFIVIPRNTVWKNNLTLFSSGVISSPNSFRTHAALGDRYMDSAMNTKNEEMRPVFYKDAYYQLKRAVELYDKEPDCHNNLAAYYYHHGIVDSAILHYKKAAEADPKFKIALDNLGIIYFNKGQFDSAFFYFMKSYKVDTSSLDALMKVARACENIKNYPLAFHYDSLILKKDAGNKQALAGTANLHNELGMQYLNNNELVKALNEFHIIQLYDSNSANNMGNIALVYKNMGDIEKAKSYYQRAIAKEPGNDTFKKELDALGISQKN